MKYKLINKNTNEETICDKVTIDGFDYYVIKADINDIKINCAIIDSYNYLYKVKSFNAGIPCDDNGNGNLLNNRKVIATNNPNIGISKVVDKAEIMADEYFKDTSFGTTNIYDSYKKFIDGYNKSQETHPFSEKDIIEFYKWVNQPHPEDNRQPLAVYVKNIDMWWYNHKKYTTKELLQLWKEQQPKIIYYEN